MNSYTVSFIGAGKISEALIERLIRSGALPASQIMACDPSSSRLDDLKRRYSGLNTSADNASAAFGTFVILATPPPETASSLANIQPKLKPDAIVISLAAGVPLHKLVSAAPNLTILRVMPNTPSMVGEGMNLVCYPPDASPDVRHRVESLLSLFGRSLEIEELDIEAYGALCSVGPTFLFPLVQSLIAAATGAGLSERSARMAVAQVFTGTGNLLAATDRSLTELNGMIGLHTLREPEAAQLISDAYNEALAKLKGLAARMSASA